MRAKWLFLELAQLIRAIVFAPKQCLFLRANAGSEDDSLVENYREFLRTRREAFDARMNEFIRTKAGLSDGLIRPAA